MPTIAYEAKRLTPNAADVIVGTQVTKGLVTGATAKIRSVGPDGVNFHRDSVVLDAAVLETQSIPMSGLNEVFGLSVTAVYAKAKTTDASASVEVQVTIDGTNYLVWGGAAWVAAALGGDYNTLGEFNDNCASLPLANPKQLGFRIRLLNFGGDTPVVSAVNAFVEWDSQPYFDLYPTLKDLMESRLELPVMRRAALSQATDRINLDSRYTVAVAGPFSVYNVSVDPNKNTNLFLQYDAANQQIVMSAQQAGGSIIEYNFEGTCDVEVVRPDELVEVSEIPTTIVVIGDASEVAGGMVGRIVEYKLGTNTKRARSRLHPVYRSCGVTVQHWARSAREAINAINRIEKVFNLGVVLLSTGEKLSLVVESEATFRDLTGQSYYSGSFAVRLFFYEHIEEYDEFGVVTQINTNLGSFNQDWPDDAVISGG